MPTQVTCRFSSLAIDGLPPPGKQFAMNVVYDWPELEILLKTMFSYKFLDFFCNRVATAIQHCKGKINFVLKIISLPSRIQTVNLTLPKLER